MTTRKCTRGHDYEVDVITWGPAGADAPACPFCGAPAESPWSTS